MQHLADEWQSYQCYKPINSNQGLIDEQHIEIYCFKVIDILLYNFTQALKQVKVSIRNSESQASMRTLIHDGYIQNKTVLMYPFMNIKSKQSDVYFAMWLFIMILFSFNRIGIESIKHFIQLKFVNHISLRAGNL